MVAPPAVDVSWNWTKPPLVITIELPAVALFSKSISPRTKLTPTWVARFCVIPELLVMPTPLMVSVMLFGLAKAGAAVIVNALAPELNMIPSTCVLAERETLVILEEANIAASDGPFGAKGGDQLVLLFQFPEVGIANHVEPMPMPLLRAAVRSKNIAAAARQ